MGSGTDRVAQSSCLRTLRFFCSEEPSRVREEAKLCATLVARSTVRTIRPLPHPSARSPIVPREQGSPNSDTRGLAGPRDEGTSTDGGRGTLYRSEAAWRAVGLFGLGQRCPKTGHRQAGKAPEVSNRLQIISKLAERGRWYAICNSNSQRNCDSTSR